MSGIKKRLVFLGSFFYIAIEVVANLVTIADSAWSVQLLNFQSIIKMEDSLIQIQWLIKKHQTFRTVSLLGAGMLGVVFVMMWWADKKEKPDTHFISLLSGIILLGASLMLIALLILTQPVSVLAVLVSGVLLGFGLYILWNGVLAIWRYTSFKPQ